MKFEIKSPYKTSPGQAQAIEKIVSGFAKFDKQTLLGITGSGKTFVMANVIQKMQRPTLIIAHNKTLAAQLYTELKELFPQNRVEYFISYYDYYQPESYMPATDTYIEKDSAVNEQIEKMRLHAVSSLVSRNDTIVVASISCIYGIGNPEDFNSMSVVLREGAKISRQGLLHSLIEIQYERNSQALESGRFRVRGDSVDVIPAYESNIIRVEIEEDRIKSIKEIDHLSGELISKIDSVTIYPARQYVVPPEKQHAALEKIREELIQQLPKLPMLEAQRLEKKVKYDLEMIKEMGYCSGIENYSRHFDGRREGEPPYVLLDYFPKDFLLIIDESHQTVPQSRAMYNGDYMRKKNLIDFGFRLPSAFDNRPLKFEEFEAKMGTTLFVSATPAEYELGKSGQEIELITRPTGLLDPVVEVKPIEGQMRYLMEQAKETIAKNNRVLITTLTKKMAEDLTDFLAKEGFKVRYLHSEIESMQRIELIRQLRAREFDILVGINLLREGLDIPEVGTIFILDADKEGFLRDTRSLIQTIGRAARNVDGKVILFADKMTHSIEEAVRITEERRAVQMEYNKKYKITPKTIIKKIEAKKSSMKGIKHLGKSDIQKELATMDAEMKKFAETLQFEKAIEMRDRIEEMKKLVERREK
ncbi:MAG: excinuclease ABC subunit UvrB [Candidatus Micrarchaeota archaeon]|nr:excinuclease ABC subunit UvrB [Candidatus Micrarchaeota archaeon]